MGADRNLVDFTLLRDDIFMGFEVLDLTATGSQSVKIADADVHAMTDNGTLRIDATAEDGVRLVGNWAIDNGNSAGLFDANNTRTHYAYTTDYVVGTTHHPLTVMIPVSITPGFVFITGEGGDVLLPAAADPGNLYASHATEGDDEFHTNAGGDSVSAGGGNDIIDTGAGADTVDGGTGNDTVLAGDGNDNVSGGAGNDDIDSGTGDDLVDAGTGDDVVVAGDGLDTLLGETAKTC